MKGQGMMKLWCLDGYGVIHPWYETAAELLSVVRGKSYLWDFKIIYPIPGELNCWLARLLLAVVAKVSLLMPLVFVLFQVAMQKIPKFPKVSFEWAINVKVGAVLSIK